VRFKLANRTVNAKTTISRFSFTPCTNTSHFQSPIIHAEQRAVDEYRLGRLQIQTVYRHVLRYDLVDENKTMRERHVYVYAWSVSWLLLESCQLDRVSSVHGRLASSHLAVAVPCGPVFIVIPSAPSTDWYKQGSGVHPPHLTVCKYIGLYIIIMSGNRSFPSLHSIRYRPSVTNSTLSANRCILSASAAGSLLRRACRVVVSQKALCIAYTS